VSAVLLTGMSGAGVSTVLRALGECGYRVVDTDDGGWACEVDLPDGSGREQLWDEGRMAQLLATDHEGTLVVGGCASNQGGFYDRFDAVILLSAPVEVMRERISQRVKSFGKQPEEWRRILGDVELAEPLLRASCTAEIRTDRPLEAVVSDVLRLIRTLTA
jgi:dephospho-CoA kinase